MAEKFKDVKSLIKGSGFDSILRAINEASENAANTQNPEERRVYEEVYRGLVGILIQKNRTYNSSKK